ncbi:hypothetical protein OF83DRAFT_1158612 [Amylostereum chailletii]|nr:hypothetical protein OF83DRAFT_1158612 [Amylostereum chailletii]
MHPWTPSHPRRAFSLKLRFASTFDVAPSVAFDGSIAGMVHVCLHGEARGLRTLSLSFIVQPCGVRDTLQTLVGAPRPYYSVLGGRPSSMVHVKAKDRAWTSCERPYMGSTAVMGCCSLPCVRYTVYVTCASHRTRTYSLVRYIVRRSMGLFAVVLARVQCAPDAAGHATCLLQARVRRRLYCSCVCGVCSKLQGFEVFKLPSLTCTEY